jgi:hypothetical protein
MVDVVPAKAGIVLRVILNVVKDLTWRFDNSA